MISGRRTTRSRALRVAPGGRCQVPRHGRIHFVRPRRPFFALGEDGIEMKTNAQLQSELVEEFRTMTPGADDLQKCSDSVDVASSGTSRTADLTDPQTDAAWQSGSASPQVPSHEDIARRAFDIYVKKGRPQGQCRQNWWEAEQELNFENQGPGVAHLSGSETPPLPHGG
jgi:hypothetical protein